MLLLQWKRQANLWLGLVAKCKRYDMWYVNSLIARKKISSRPQFNSDYSSVCFIEFLECSRLRHTLEQNGRTDVTLHCSQNGNFEELQCDNGICWCADAKTGRVSVDTRAVPQNLWNFLPCCKF